MYRSILNKNGFSLIAFVFLIVVNCPSLGQFPRLNFKSFTEKDGLSKEYVRSVCQDKDGFMWFGTPDGIDKFDGKNFINYNSLFIDSASGTYQICYDIHEDKNGILWIATYSNGIILFDKNRETIKRLKYERNNPVSLSNNKVLDLYEDRDSNIWIGTAGGGINLWLKDRKSFVHYRHDSKNPASLGSDYSCSIAGDSKGNIWVLSIDGIISKLDRNTGAFENIILPLQSHSTTMRRGFTHAICIDSQDNVIVGSYYGLFIIDSITGKIKHIPHLNPDYNVTFIVSSIVEIEKDIIAVATTFQGLYLLNIITGEYVNYSNSPLADYFLNNTSITSIYKSKDGLIWLGSFYGGVNVYDKAFSQFELLADITKSGSELFSGTRGAAFCKSPDNKIWIATGNNDIVEYDPVMKSAREVLNNLSLSAISCLYTNKNGEILIGSDRNGLIIYNPITKTFISRKYNSANQNSLASDYIFSAIQDRDEIIWISYTGIGLDAWDRKTDKITHYINDPDDSTSLISNVIYKIIEDRSGRIWIGSLDGLCWFDKEKKTFNRYPLFIDKKAKQTLNTILDIFEDSKGNIWVGTDRALFKLDPDQKSSEVFIPKNEIPYLITNIMEDRGNNIWMTSFNKLFKLNTSNNEFTVYNFYNGNTSPSFLGSGCFSFDGQFYLGSLDRIITFDPDSIKQDIVNPKIYITQFEIDNVPADQRSPGILTKHINFTDSINLNFDQSTFSFSFAAQEYSFPEKVRYAYMLENFDDDWIYAGNLNNRAVYTKVPPGKYTFRVMATDKKEEWYESDQRISVTIKPPIWDTRVFKLIVVLLVIAIVYGLTMLRSKKLNQQKKRLEETVKQRTMDLNEAHARLAEQHEEVVQQNDSLNILSQKILNQNKELEMHYNKLEKLVDERTAELKEAKNKAEESDKLKSAFLANMSHEIRTPMNAIVGFANLLRGKELTKNDREKYIEIINANSDSLLVLIDDILDLSMIEANQLIVRNDIIDLNQFMDNLYSSFSMLNNNPELKVCINNELYSQKLRIRVDKERTKQILTNLVNNALKFTKKGFVELGLKRIANNIAFYVKDTGIGIKKSEIDSIFERFRKSEGNDNVLYRGAGLGLSISKALAYLMEGNLIVESEVGKGSVFTLMLPETIIYKENDKPDYSSAISLNKKFKNVKNILVAEDEITNYMYLEMAIAQPDIKVFHAENGLEALKMIQSGSTFDLILMDIKMPVMDGLEATKAIKAINPQQYIVAITAFARPDEKRRFMEAGFDDYMSKPVRPHELRHLLEKFL
ncbi:MAG TPA: two-component regulator propeller domain-containing protein [Bacteroidales bacterium]|nr:two-component regulator propeller domain-containing protein [Bacteroidales bacterium]